MPRVGVRPWCMRVTEAMRTRHRRFAAIDPTGQPSRDRAKNRRRIARGEASRNRPAGIVAGSASHAPSLAIPLRTGDHLSSTYGANNVHGPNSCNPEKPVKTRPCNAKEYSVQERSPPQARGCHNRQSKSRICGPGALVGTPPCAFPGLHERSPAGSRAGSRALPESIATRSRLVLILPAC